MSRCSVFTRNLYVALTIFCLAAVSPVYAQSVTDVYPLEPEDETRVGSLILFKIGVEGTDPDLIKYRISLNSKDSEGKEYVFDQTKDRNGWAHAALETTPGAYFRLTKPLEDGEYSWRPDAWNGIQWIEGDHTFTIIVDTVPPADVEGLEMEVDRDSGKVKLRWDPVFFDLDGHSDEIAKYRIFRYQSWGLVNMVTRHVQIGETDDTRFVDDIPPVTKSPLFFYKVRAEDVAGNLKGARNRIRVSPDPEGDAERRRKNPGRQ